MRSTILPSSYTFANSNQGTHTFSVVLEPAGPQSLTATDDALASLAITDPTISVQPAAAHSLVLTGLPASVLTGTSDPLTVTARCLWQRGDWIHRDDLV